MKILSNITAIILLLFGSAWVLAGLNILGDTSMSGERLWAAVGAATATGAIAFLVTTNRARSFPE
ncbi:MAG: hypothetical protein QOH65_3372 [Methylobacteriaceae bacterium]|jgi:hypothetical protein|nr:hypothetical protein [Methylobacteriaceae bacterium]